MTDCLRWMTDLDVASRALQPLRDIQGLSDPFTKIRHHMDIENRMLATLRQQDGWRKPFAEMGQIGALTKLSEELDRHRKFFEVPLERAWRVGAFAPGVSEAIRAGLTAAQVHRIAHIGAFRLPQVNEIETLARRAAEAAELTRRTFAKTALEVEMARMHQPWLRVGAEAASARGFSEILAIGHGVAKRRPFGDGLVEALRGPLGDWRDPISSASDRWLDDGARTAFYLDRGFDSALTNFAAPAFDASLRIARLRTDQAQEEGEDQGADRADEAFATLRAFEIAVRRFLDSVMTEAFGNAWIRQRLPPNMLDEWKTKREKAKASGRFENSLISYADFSDYQRIIDRADNWEDVFKRIFGRREDVRESFQRLYPIRIATMHSRIITLDDELYLRVETRRILKAIGGAN